MACPAFFAGAEVIAVGIGFYLSAMGVREMEVVSVDSDKVAVEKGRRFVRQRWELQRAWAQIRLLSPRIRWYPTRLVIRSHGREVELGGFLNEEERQQLFAELRHTLGDSGE